MGRKKMTNSRIALPGVLTVLLAAAFPIACGNVTAIAADGGQEGGKTQLPGEGGSGGSLGGTSGSKGTGTGGTSSVGAGGQGAAGTRTDGGLDAGPATGLTGAYSFVGGTTNMNRVDPTIDFNPGLAGFEPTEVMWTGEVDVDGTAAISLSGNSSDQLSIYLHNQNYSNGETTGTGQVTTTIPSLFTGWASITIDIKRSDLTSPFEAVLSRQLSSGSSTGSFASVPTDVLKPE
jgi:hypothetical protein